MHRRLLSLTRDSRAALLLTILSGFLAGLLTIGQAYLLSSTVNGVFLEGQTLRRSGLLVATDSCHHRRARFLYMAE